jgi:DNA-binding NtrC family response regulator
MEPKPILIIDDDRLIQKVLEHAFSEKGWDVDTAENAEKGLLLMRSKKPRVLILDIFLPGKWSGLELLRLLKADRELKEIIVVMMTAYGTVETAVASMKEGALDYLTKPIDLEELLLKFQKVIERSTLIQENRTLRERLQEHLHFPQIVYGSPEMEEVMGLVARVAPSQATVLIRGESGTMGRVAFRG